MSERKRRRHTKIQKQKTTKGHEGKTESKWEETKKDSTATRQREKGKEKKPRVRVASRNRLGTTVSRSVRLLGLEEEKWEGTKKGSLGTKTCHHDLEKGEGGCKSGKVEKKDTERVRREGRHDTGKRRDSKNAGVNKAQKASGNPILRDGG
jgi:hypothetical protein